MSDDLEEPTGRTVAGKITWDINISTIVVLVGAIATGIVFVAQARSQAEQAQRDIARLEGTLQQGFAGLRQDISTLPDQRARLGELERRMGDNDRWHVQLEESRARGRDDLTRLRDDVTHLQADMSTVSKGGTPARR